LFVDRIRSWLEDKIGPGSSVYSIFKPCKRCSYGKRYDPIMIYSFKRKVRAIVFYNGNTYFRRGECIGLDCGRCLQKIDDPSIDLPCSWIKS